MLLTFFIHTTGRFQINLCLPSREIERRICLPSKDERCFSFIFDNWSKIIFFYFYFLSWNLHTAKSWQLNKVWMPVWFTLNYLCFVIKISTMTWEKRSEGKHVFVTYRVLHFLYDLPFMDYINKFGKEYYIWSCKYLIIICNSYTANDILLVHSFLC